jgi:anti-sigma factor RsiW
MTRSPDMTCRDVLEFLDRYVDGGLSDAERREFDRHFGVCRTCREYVLAYRRTIALSRSALRGSPETRSPASAPRGLIDAIKAARRVG